MQSVVKAGVTLSKRSTMLLQQTRNHWVVTPPQNRISFAEKLVHGLIISVGVITAPAYILSNLETYKGRG